MKKLLLIIAIFFMNSPVFSAEDWGPTGHRAVGAIAESYLSPEVKQIIDDILGGQSLALVSTFADEIRSDDRYKEFAPWHYVNFPVESTYEESSKSEKGDIIVAINKCVEVLKSEKSSKEDKAFYLKMLVHFMGDLHQPLHVGLAEDRGGNRFQVQWFDEGTNLHRVWDKKIIEEFGMSYTELAQNTSQLSQEELDNIQKGSVLDWVYDSRTLFEDVYKHTKVGEKLSYEYMYRYAHRVRFQLQKGGIRLGKMLNSIFE